MGRDGERWGRGRERWRGMERWVEKEGGGMERGWRTEVGRRCWRRMESGREGRDREGWGGVWVGEELEYLRGKGERWRGEQRMKRGKERIERRVEDEEGRKG